jgi:hypothetical protein
MLMDERRHRVSPAVNLSLSLTMRVATGPALVAGHGTKTAADSRGSAQSHEAHASTETAQRLRLLATREKTRLHDSDITAN